METQLIQKNEIQYLREDDDFRSREPWRLINDITREILNLNYSDDFKIIFHNITDGCSIPENLKFVAFDWKNNKIVVYREPTIKVYSFKDYNDTILNLKKNEPRFLKEGLVINDNRETYKRIFYLKDIAKHKVKEIKKENTIIKVGDFLNTSWGYDQTNVELFVIKKILGKNYFIIQEIRQQIASSEMQYDNVKVSDTVEKIDLPMKAFISNNGYMSVSETGYKRSLSLTELNAEHYRTNSMFGH